MLRRARNTVFWLNMAKDLRDTVNNCDPCQTLRPANRKEPLLQHKMGEKPWEKIGMDLFEIENRSYLVMVDYFSNFTEVDYLPNPTSGEVIKKVKSLCARYGIPKVLVSDNGPQFASHDFKNFTHGWNISHHTSSPRYPQSNGKAEAAVKTIKHMMIKAVQNRTDPYLALLELRNTPRQDSGVSPASLVFGHDTRSLIPSLCNKPRYTREEIQNRTLQRKYTVKKHYDKTSHSKPQVQINDPVFFRRTVTSPWEQGQIKDKVRERSFIINTPEGAEYRRNSIHIRPDNSTRVISEQDAQNSGNNEIHRDPGSEEVTIPDQSATFDTPTERSRPIRNKRPPTWLKDYN